MMVSKIPCSDVYAGSRFLNKPSVCVRYSPEVFSVHDLGAFRNVSFGRINSELTVVLQLAFEPRR